MIKLPVLYIQFILFLALLYSPTTSAVTHLTNNYLLKPTGSYGVGYQDIFIINQEICPDAFYRKNINESDFSSINKKYCHECILRVYYPSLESHGQSNEYYAPFLIGMNRWIIKNNKLSTRDATKLNDVLKIKTYASANLKSVNNQKFPIVIFMAGSGQSVQTYNNIVSNLVSDGYIVIGINSLFINGPLKLNNEQVVPAPDAYLDVDGRTENMRDLKFVLEHLRKMKFKFNLEKNMDFNKISLIGHSRGAMSIVNVLKNKNYKHVKSIILMDPADMLMEANYPLPQFNIPAMIMWSSHFKTEVKGEALLGKNNYEIILRSKNANDSFSYHNNFSDQGTLQYHPAYQIPPIHRELAVGEGNGYEIATAINYYVLTFLNNSLKNKGAKKNLECKDFDDIYPLKCGR
jgi:predicted esterase